MKMTNAQKLARKYARMNGARSLRSIRFAMYPVYEDDARTHTDLAFMYARSAAHHASMYLDSLPIRKPAPR